MSASHMCVGMCISTAEGLLPIPLSGSSWDLGCIVKLHCKAPYSDSDYVARSAPNANVIISPVCTFMGSPPCIDKVKVCLDQTFFLTLIRISKQSYRNSTHK